MFILFILSKILFTFFLKRSAIHETLTSARQHNTPQQHLIQQFLNSNSQAVQPTIPQQQQQQNSSQRQAIVLPTERKVSHLFNYIIFIYLLS